MRGLTRWLNAHDPFKLCYVSIGSRLGSSTASYLATSEQLVKLNFVLSLVWLPLVIIPQIAYSDCGRDFHHDNWYMFSSQTSLDSNATWDGEPAIYFFGGYKPRYFPSGYEAGPGGTATTDETAWPMDACYLTAIFFTYGISMVYLVLAIGRKVRRPVVSRPAMAGDARHPHVVTSGNVVCKLRVTPLGAFTSGALPVGR